MVGQKGHSGLAPPAQACVVKNLSKALATTGIILLSLIHGSDPTLAASPPMKPHRFRQTCRAHNRFTPSIALWHHFVVLCHPLLRQQRLSSTASGSVASPQQDGVYSPANQPEHKTAETDEPPRPSRLRRIRLPPPGSVLKKVEVDPQQRRRQSEVMRIARMAFSEAGDYTGVVVKPITTRFPWHDLTPPWVVPITPELKADPHARLSLEIAKFHEYAKPGRYEALARRNVIEQIRNRAHKILPDHVLEVFGSERTGLATAISDIDLRLAKRVDATDDTELPPTRQQRKEYITRLYRLYFKHFLEDPDFLTPTIRHARYPLISMQHRASGLDVQIVLANDTSVSRDMMHRYMLEYPYLHQVFMTVKAIFDSRGLSDVFRGGFGSYSIFMMLVASVRHYPSARGDAAGALLNFLEFWASFDTKQGVSIEPVELFDKTANPVMSDITKTKILSGDLKPLPPYMLCLRDPANPKNDLGRRGVCIKHVQSTLASLHHNLTRGFENQTTPPVTFLKPMVGSMHTLNLERRKKLEDEGRRVFAEAQSIKTEEALPEEEISVALGLSGLE